MLGPAGEPAFYRIDIRSKRIETNAASRWHQWRCLWRHARTHRGLYAPGRYRLSQSVGDGGDGLPRQRLLQTENGIADLGLLSVLGPHRTRGVERAGSEVAARHRPAENSAARIHEILRRQQRD